MKGQIDSTYYKPVWYVGGLICGIPNPNIPSNPSNTICQTKLLLWNSDTVCHLFQTASSYCSHIVFSSLSLLFSTSLLSYTHIAILQSFAAAPPSRGNPFWLVATDTTRTCLPMFWNSARYNGGGAVAVSRGADWTSPQRRRKTNLSQLASLPCEHVTDCPVLNTWAGKKGAKEVKGWAAGEKQINWNERELKNI